MATFDTQKLELKALLDPITFDSTTLGAAGLIHLYQKSTLAKPLTEINIFSSSLQSQYLESKLNKRFYTINIRIRCLAENREEQAQEDIDYLEEQIISILEANLNNINWSPGFLDNENIQSSTRGFAANYFIKDIPLRIVKWQPIAN